MGGWSLWSGGQAGPGTQVPTRKYASTTRDAFEIILESAGIGMTSRLEISQDPAVGGAGTRQKRPVQVSNARVRKY